MIAAYKLLEDVIISKTYKFCDTITTIQFKTKNKYSFITNWHKNDLTTTTHVINKTTGCLSRYDKLTISNNNSKRQVPSLLY